MRPKNKQCIIFEFVFAEKNHQICLNMHNMIKNDVNPEEAGGNGEGNPL
jgi:hypothetical protein